MRKLMSLGENAHGLPAVRPDARVPRPNSSGGHASSDAHQPHPITTSIRLNANWTTWAQWHPTSGRSQQPNVRFQRTRSYPL